MRLLLNIALCLFGSLVATSCLAENLGRLFFSPDQRMQLDFSSAKKSRAETNDQSLMLNGIVQTPRGSRTVWINGVSQQTTRSDDKTPASTSVFIPGKTKPVRIKVGQRVSLNPADIPTKSKLNSKRPDTTNQDAPDND